MEHFLVGGPILYPTYMGNDTRQLYQGRGMIAVQHLYQAVREDVVIVDILFGGFCFDCSFSPARPREETSLRQHPIRQEVCSSLRSRLPCVSHGAGGAVGTPDVGRCSQ